MRRTDQGDLVGNIRERLAFLATHLHGLSAGEAESVIESHTSEDGAVAASDALTEIRRRERANDNGSAERHRFLRCEEFEALRALLLSRGADERGADRRL